MKKIYLLVVTLLCISITAHAQAPELFNYQTVIRDASGKVLQNQQVTIRINIIAESNRNVAVYSELHRPTSNQFGLVNLIVGQGSPASNKFSSIDWSKENYYIETELDETGGTNLQVMGTSKLLSVPYALYARNAGSNSGSGRINEWTRTGNSLHPTTLSDRVGIGTNIPQFDLQIRGSGIRTFEVESSDNQVTWALDNTGSNAKTIRYRTNGATRGGIQMPGGTDDLRFQAGGPTDRMTISSSGDIGVGTTTPAERLHVSGGSSRFQNGTAHLTISNIGSSGEDGVRIAVADMGDHKHKEWIEILSTSVGSGQIILNPHSQFSNSGMSVSNLDTLGDNGVIMDLGSSVRVQGINPLPGGTTGGSMVFHPDRLAPDGGGRLKVSNLGSSGCDGVSIELNDNDTVGFIRFENIRPIPCALQLGPSTAAGHDHLTVSNIGSSGLDGVSIDIGRSSSLHGDHSSDPAGTGAGGELVVIPDARISGGGHLTVSNIGASGRDGVSIELNNNDTIGYLRFENSPLIPCALRLGPSTFPGHDDLLIANLGSSGLDGVSVDIGRSSRLSGDHSSDPAGTGAGGELVVIPDARISGGGQLTVSNIGASGRDGVSIELNDNDTVGYLRFENSPLIPCALRLGPSTFPGHDDLLIANLGSSGLDGVSVDIGRSSRLSGDHSSDPSASGGGGQLVIVPDRRVSGGGSLTISNIGSSGEDGVSFSNEEGEFWFEELRPGVVVPDRSVLRLSAAASQNTGRLLLYASDTLPNTGTSLVMGNGGGRLLAANAAGGTLSEMHLNAGDIQLRPTVAKEHLVVSNIGSSGEDGVRVSLATDTPVQTEIISLDLVSSEPLPILRHGTDQLFTGYTYDAVNRVIREVKVDTAAGTTADPHIFTYDGNNNLVRVDGPPTDIYESDELTTTYAYDNFDRLIRRTYADENPSSTAAADVYLYDANNNLVRQSGPPTREIESDSIMESLLFDDVARTLDRVCEDLTQPGATPYSELYDALNNEIRRAVTPDVDDSHSNLRHRLHFDALNRVVSRTYFDDGNPTSVPQSVEYDIQLQQMRLNAPSVHVNGVFTATVKNFTIDHPTDPYNKLLRHVSIESPDMLNVYNGNINTNEKGYATVKLPDYFEALNMDFRYQLTVVGEFAQAIIKEKVNDNKFVIMTDKPNVEVSWQITGVRNDSYAKENRVKVEVEKEDKMKGKLLYEPKSSSSLH